MADRSRALRVLFLIAEMAPFAKTGGLADVGASLPKALRRLGVDVRAALPKYGRISDHQYGLTTALEHLPVPFDEWVEHAVVKEGRSGPGELAVPVYFVESEKYFSREGVYGYADDGERFVFYCRAALELCRQLDWQPDIIHSNDWHTAIVPNWLKTIYREDPFFEDTATVFTIHNLAYQGVFGYRLLEIAGIEEYGFLYPQIADLANVVDLMGRGILFADIVTTVSERYAQEILTPEYGEKLDPMLRDRRDDLYGVLNGIDVEELDPTTDLHIAANYDVESLDRRTLNKLELQRRAGLPVDPAVPLIGTIGRLSSQKGYHLVAQVVEPLLAQPVQLVLLGHGDQHYHEAFARLAQQYTGRMAAFLTFNTPLAQLIYAGSDMFLMPSRYEPCGLSQMIAMRYGSVPIVRATGGLADTVPDWEPATGAGKGFAFQRYDPWDLFAAIIRAVESFKYREVWRKLQVAGMSTDFSWDRSGRRYVELYEVAVKRRRAALPRAEAAVSTSR